MKRLGLIGWLLVALLSMGAAADPSERLSDPVLEARAKALFPQIRCMVCQDESIDDSGADLAADLRKIVREEVAAGRTDAQVRTFLVERYGEYVMLKPAFSLTNAALWLTPFAIVGLGLVGLFLRKKTALDPASETDLFELTPEEQARLHKLRGSGAE
jgi:cytochrome c-type biogenesis protein CcmH